MSDTTTPPGPRVSPRQQFQSSIEGKHVCPFCGTVGLVADALCPHCKMDVAAASRPATKALIGPWYVLQPRLPAIPGITFARLIDLVKKGRIRPHSVVRGPSTHQFWHFAGQVKGLSREFGICCDCGAQIPADADACPACSCSQLPPANPDALLETSELAAFKPATDDSASEQLGESQDETEITPYSSPIQTSLRPKAANQQSNVLGTRGAIATAFNLRVSSKRRSKSRKRLILAGLLVLLVLGAATCLTIAVVSPDSAIGQWFSDMRASLGRSELPR